MPKVIKQWFIKHMPVEEDIGLHENKAFIRWIGYPLLAILVLFIAVTWNLFESGVYSFDKEFEVSFVTLNDFAKYYAFPIASLTVPLTFGVMFNRFHSSKQKAKSNYLIEKNNTANNFYTHYKYFREHCELILEKKTVEFNIDVLYNNLFPEARIDKFSTQLNPMFIKDLSSPLSELKTAYEEYGKSPYEDCNKGKMFRSDGTSKTLKSFSHEFKFYNLVTYVRINEEQMKSHESQYNEALQRIYGALTEVLNFQGISNKEEELNFIKKLSTKE